MELTGIKSLVHSDRKLNTDFRPGNGPTLYCLGDLDCDTGLLGRNGILLARRTEDSIQIKVTLRPVSQETALYPLDMSLAIPSASGGTMETIRVVAEGEQEFSIDLPSDVRVGEVFELELRADAVTMAPDVFSLRSVYLTKMVQR